MNPQALLERLTRRENLSRAEVAALFDEIMAARVEPMLLAGILAALATKGETSDEIVGAAQAMRRHVTPVSVPDGVEAIDTCSAGGDGKPTFNVSTAVAIVTAAAGATVAKHGNRSNSRPSGSAEGLTALGINVEADVRTIERCLREARIAFLYALRMHPAMAAAGPVRRALGARTIFNLVGPLTNPAGVRRQLLGVSRPELVEVHVAALRELGAERAMVVHGMDGLCDLSVSAPSRLARWDGMRITIEEIDGGAVSAPPSKLDDLFVRSAAESAALIEGVMRGVPGPARDVVVFNAAAALWVAGLAVEWRDGAERARAALDSGAAAATLGQWRRLSQDTRT